nr:MAG TPA: hypothetical protein [Caudoviricetes sp.]
MKAIKNLEILLDSKIIDFDNFNDDWFYQIFILKRKKDDGVLKKNSSLIKSYRVSNLEYLNRKLEEEIIPLCDFFKARAMINVNMKSYRKVAFESLKKLAEEISQEHYKAGLDKLITSACSTTGMVENKSKKWIIDLDSKDEKYKQEIIRIINSKDMLRCYNDGDNDRIIGIIPSKSGYHLVSNPFDINQFLEILKIESIYEDNHLTIPEIKKEGLTNLYIPDYYE